MLTLTISFEQTYPGLLSRQITEIQSIFTNTLKINTIPNMTLLKTNIFVITTWNNINPLDLLLYIFLNISYYSQMDSNYMKLFHKFSMILPIYSRLSNHTTFQQAVDIRYSNYTINKIIINRINRFSLILRLQYGSLFLVPVEC